MSFTQYYFKYGFNTTIEKVAAKKKDEGMSTAAKLGLGAAGLGLGGLGAYYGGDALRGLAELGQEHGGETIRGITPYLESAGIWGQDNLQAPMKAGIDHVSDYAKDLYKQYQDSQTAKDFGSEADENWKSVTESEDQMKGMMDAKGIADNEAWNAPGISTGREMAQNKLDDSLVGATSLGSKMDPSQVEHLDYVNKDFDPSSLEAMKKGLAENAASMKSQEGVQGSKALQDVAKGLSEDQASRSAIENSMPVREVGSEVAGVPATSPDASSIQQLADQFEKVKGVSWEEEPSEFKKWVEGVAKPWASNAKGHIEEGIFRSGQDFKNFDFSKYPEKVMESIRNAKSTGQVMQDEGISPVVEKIQNAIRSLQGGQVDPKVLPDLKGL